MQKIDKSNILSTQYKEWAEGILGDHPVYSSSHKYIKDIKMSLLACQKGLCAYTEELLCDPALITLDNWSEEGKYATELDNQNLVNGDLEHFDCSLKETQGYLWDNLFMVNSNINCRVKGTREVHPILKPDSVDYDPNIYLQFDDVLNRFIPNNNLEEEEKARVLEMIDTLGLNRNAFKRARQIKSLKEDLELNLPLRKPQEYITSWKMTLHNLQN
jgi:hypothetical protein